MTDHSAKHQPAPPAKRRRPGRPSLYAPELVDTILGRMAKGESLSAICREPGMPDIGTVLDWQDRHPEFLQRYTRARELQAMTLVEGIFEIADDGTNDFETDDDGKRIVNHDHIARSRLRVDTRKWFASKVLPKLYGDKQQLEHSGKLSLENLVTAAIAAADPPKPEPPKE